MTDHFFDTTVLVAYFKHEDAATHDLISHILNGEATAAISAITIAELWAVSEMDDPQIQNERQALVDLLQIVPTDRVIAQRAGAIRRKHNLKLPDALIAASCLQAGGHLFSKDPHFRRLIEQQILEGTVY